SEDTILSTSLRRLKLPFLLMFEGFQRNWTARSNISAVMPDFRLSCASLSATKSFSLQYADPLFKLCADGLTQSAEVRMPERREHPLDRQDRRQDPVSSERYAIGLLHQPQR
ncbi:MAG: hypothetical protein AAGH68_12385, partial [Pseudomonadota bacterium]